MWTSCDDKHISLTNCYLFINYYYLETKLFDASHTDDFRHHRFDLGRFWKLRETPTEVENGFLLKNQKLPDKLK